MPRIQVTGEHPVLIVDNNPRRKRLLLASESLGNFIAIGDSSVRWDTGFRLCTLETITLYTKKAIYAICASGDTRWLSYWEEEEDAI